jgi:hypothetical protein
MVDDGLDVLRTAVQPRAYPSLRGIAEFGGKHHPIAAALDDAAEQLLVGERPVDFCCVQERAPQVDRTQDCFLRFLVVRLPVGIGHPHAAEPNRRDF